jgi:CRISPR/Cas system-associated exonuclease Cas4 (RecB family)
MDIHAREILAMQHCIDFACVTGANVNREFFCPEGVWYRSHAVPFAAGFSGRAHLHPWQRSK